MDPKTVSEIINELGEDRSQYYNAVTPPIFQTSNFAFDTVESFRQGLMDESAAFLYSRGNNPTVNILSAKLAALDHAEECLVVNSGAGAIFVAILANVQAGDHIISVENPYSWARKMMENVLPRFNVTTTFVDGRDVKNFEDAIQHNTRLIYLESPNSWTFFLQDIEAVANLARKHQITTICDNSYATPIYQRPLDLGIDISVQSATKYINGHSDVVAGVICSCKEIMDKIFYSEYLNLGIGTTPFNAWLILRGLRTLPARLDRITRTTEKVVAFIKSRDEVESVSFPMDPDFPQRELARKQMTGACGLFSFVLKTHEREAIRRFTETLRHILMAVSWGGHESLIMPAIATIKKEDFDPADESHRRIRLYVGLEDAEHIIEDLEKGFDAMKQS